jgi:hypothetical protein
MELLESNDRGKPKDLAGGWTSSKANDQVAGNTRYANGGAQPPGTNGKKIKDPD